jgi:trimeric autotransporter adhesin
MALTWADFNNGESALSIRNKINTFNNAAVTEVTSIASAANSNLAAITANTTNITTNTANIATNTANIVDLDTRVDTIETTLAEGVSDFATLIGSYPTPAAYSLTGSYQDVANYTSSGSDGFTVDTVAGTMSPSHTGYYRISSFMSGDTSESSQKIATVAFVEDGVTVMEGSTSFISATGLNRSFTAIFPMYAGRVYKLQIKADAASGVSMKSLNFSANYVGNGIS